MKKYLIVFIFFSLASFSQEKDAKKRLRAKTESERKVSLTELKNAIELEDLLTGFPDDCIVVSSRFLVTYSNSPVKIETYHKSKEIPKKLFTDDTRSVYINIESPCKEYSNNYKLIVTK